MPTQLNCPLRTYPLLSWNDTFDNTIKWDPVILDTEHPRGFNKTRGLGLVSVFWAFWFWLCLWVLGHTI